ncbi:MAG: hypothetical protein R2717_01445 [Schumannella sp.]
MGGKSVTKIRYWGGKYIVDGIRHYFEAKVGYAASAFVHAQVTKDIAQAAAPGARVIEWHFWASGLTGKIGPSLPPF